MGQIYVRASRRAKAHLRRASKRGSSLAYLKRVNALSASVRQSSLRAGLRKNFELESSRGKLADKINRIGDLVFKRYVEKSRAGARYRYR